MTEQYPFSADQFILVGKVTRAHGIKGELKIVELPGRPEIENYSRAALVAVDGRMTALLELEKVRRQGRQIILKLATIDTKNEADLTAGMGVLLALDDLREDEVMFDSLELITGKKVRRKDTGLIIGTVAGFFSNGAQDIMVVKDNEAEFLIPLIDEIVLDCTGDEVLIDPPAGLLEINTRSGD